MDEPLLYSNWDELNGSCLMNDNKIYSNTLKKLEEIMISRNFRESLTLPALFLIIGLIILANIELGI